MKQDTLIETIPIFGKLIGMTTDEMEKTTLKIQNSFGTNNDNPFAAITEVAEQLDKEAMFVGAALYAYLISLLAYDRGDENDK